MGASHMLPKYVLDKLLARDIAYQTVEKGATSYLLKNNKKILANLPYTYLVILSGEK